MTASPAAAEEISLDAAVAAVLSEVDGIVALKKRTALKAFLCVQHVFTLVRHFSTLQYH